jgi:nucleoside-diphosphate-sugar epimerase
MGYIGAVLVPMLLEEGFDVVGLDSGLYVRCTFGKEPVAIPELRIDIRDVEPGDLEGFEAVVHLAALSNDPLGNLDPELTYDINHRATIRIAEIAREAGCERFLFSSSCSVYGASGDELANESAPFNPVTPYGETKAWVERDLSAMAVEGFSPVFLRNATAYGLSPRHRFDLVLNNLLAWAVAQGSILMKSDGTPWRPIVHIRDISAAFIAALRAPTESIHNMAFNIGFDGENYQIRELADIVAEIVPGCTIDYAEGAGPDTRCYRVDFSRAATDLPGFTQSWTARTGAEEMYRAYRDEGIRIEDVEGVRYNRIDHIRHLIDTAVIDRQLRVRSQVPGGGK